MLSCVVCSEKVSFTLWDHWEVRGGKNFKLSDFLKAVEVSLLQIHVLLHVDWNILMMNTQ